MHNRPVQPVRVAACFLLLPRPRGSDSECACLSFHAQARSFSIINARQSPRSLSSKHRSWRSDERSIRPRVTSRLDPAWLQPPRFRPAGRPVDRGSIAAVLQRGCVGPGALGGAEPSARRGQDQRQRKPHGPLPRGGRGHPQDCQPGGALPLQGNLRVYCRSWPTSRESRKST